MSYGVGGCQKSAKKCHLLFEWPHIGTTVFFRGSKLDLLFCQSKVESKSQKHLISCLIEIPRNNCKEIHLDNRTRIRTRIFKNKAFVEPFLYWPEAVGRVLDGGVEGAFPRAVEGAQVSAVLDLKRNPRNES